MVPEGTIQAKDLTGQALPDATVNIIDLSTDAIIATTTTDATGHYQVSVPPGGPYLLEAVKGSVKLEQITCSVEVGIEYDLGTADCVTTAAALIAQAMMDAGDNPADIDCDAIIADPNFGDVSSIVCSTIQAGQDPTTSAVIEEAVEDFLNPPAPAPTPTYTVTFNKNGGDIEADPITKTVTHGGNVGTLPTEPTRTGYTFTSWNTEVGGGGTEFTAATAVTADITVYAQWTINTYTVTYDGNGNTGGTVPVDLLSPYEYGATVTVLDNTGSLFKTGYTFDGWNTAADGSGTNRAVGSNFTTGASNVTLYAKWTPLYALRDTGPAGGLIFYVKEGGYSDGWMYLEAAPATTEWTSKWWGSLGTWIERTGTDIGTGQSNTTAIVDWLDANTDDIWGDVTNKTNRAAYLCDALILGDYDDWFLPSRDELKIMRENLYVFGVGSFAGMNYWSSSEDGAYIAWSQNYGNGIADYDGKGNANRVRAVRAF